MDRILLEESCEILDSRRIPITASNRKEGPYPYYGANGIQDYVDDYIFDDELVLLAEDGGNFGSKERPIAYRVSGKCWVNNHAHVLKPKDGINVDYLCYSLMFYDTEKLVNGATRQKLTQAMMRKMLIPKRSISEQKKIVATLNTIRDSIVKQAKRIKLLDNLIKARFVEMFGGIDRYISIKDSGLFIADGNYSSKYPRSSEFTSFGVPFIRANNIKDNTVVDDDMYFISPEKHDELKKGHLLHGDILVTTRGNIGQLGIVPQKHNNSNINAQIVLLRCRDTKYLPEYLLFALQTVDVKKQFIRQQTGTALKQLPVKHLEKISFIDAPVELQNQFVTFVTQVDKSKFALRKSIKSLMNLWYNINKYVCERTYGEA